VLRSTSAAAVSSQVVSMPSTIMLPRARSRFAFSQAPWCLLSMKMLTVYESR
jgi:hypothetical protein